MDSAYEKIYRDFILIYLTSDYKIDSEKTKEWEKKYVTIIFKYCGESIIDSLILLHGSYDSIVAFIANDFMIRLGNS